MSLKRKRYLADLRPSWCFRRCTGELALSHSHRGLPRGHALNSQAGPLRNIRRSTVTAGAGDQLSIPRALTMTQGLGGGGHWQAAKMYGGPAPTHTSLDGTHPKCEV